MQSNPTVSLLLLCQNHARFIQEALESALAQSSSCEEMVIVDNHSTDGSWELIQQSVRRQPRVRAMQPDAKLTIAGALNFGLLHVSGKYLAPMDSDDAWLPKRLERQLNFLEQNRNRDVGVCGTHCQLIDAHSRVLGTKDYPLGHEACVQAFWYRNPVCHSAALIRKDCFDRLGVYDETFDLVQDLDFWFRVGRRYRLANLAEYLTQVRLSNTNASLRFQRRVIAKTLQVRRRAMSEYGYKAGWAGWVALAATWLAQWLPAKPVRRAFNQLFLPHGAFLWRERSGQTSADHREPVPGEQKADPTRSTDMVT